MSKERVDPDKMANDLAGASAFFKGLAPATSAAAPQPGAPAPPSITTPQAVPPTQRAVPGDTNVHPVRPGRDGRPARRIMIRHPFELYADQLEALRDLADRERRRGEGGSMSRMVREAIDRLIAEADPNH